MSAQPAGPPATVGWLAGSAIYRIVDWWIAFVVLTIAGERLELNRLVRPSAAARALFASAVALVATGACVAAFRPGSGVRLTGGGLIAVAGWLGAFDIARRTLRQRGETRFIAVCLLSSYLWLAIAGAIMVTTAASSPGLEYDAALHAVFLGFAVAMIFGHAPIVFPAILGARMRFTRAFYLHLALLHASVVVRLVGDLVEPLARVRATGGMLNALALLLFVVNTAAALGHSIPRRA